MFLLVSKVLNLLNSYTRLSLSVRMRTFMLGSKVPNGYMLKAALRATFILVIRITYIQIH